MNIELLYIIVDDFMKEFRKSSLWNDHRYLWENKRGKKKSLSLSEVMTLNLCRFHFHHMDLKAFHRQVKTSMIDLFPKTPNYENFLKATNKSMPFILIFMEYLLYLNRLAFEGGEHFVDSTSLSVCLNHNISSHKVTVGMSDRGMSTKGWFYGLKLHGVCSETGDLEQVFFTPGNIHDSTTLEGLVDSIKGTIVCDAGYLVKQDVFARIWNNMKKLYVATRKNMKKIMTETQKRLFRKRSIIETTWGVLKQRLGIESHLARSINGLFRHYLYAITFFLIKKQADRGCYPLMIG